MEVILKQDVKNLGEKDDVVNVKPGYGRNFLLPQGMAVLATESNKKVLAENIRQAQFKQDKVKKDAEKIADRKSVVEGKSVSVRVDLGGGRSIKKKKKKTQE